MVDGDEKPPPSNVRQGLALVCIGAIGAAIGLASKLGSDDSERSIFDDPSIGEQIAQIVGGLGFLVMLIGLAYVAYGLLRD